MVRPTVWMLMRSNEIWRAIKHSESGERKSPPIWNEEYLEYFFKSENKNKYKIK